MPRSQKRSLPRGIMRGTGERADGAAQPARAAGSRGDRGGPPNKLIAYDLGISVRTVEVHRAHMLDRLGVRITSQQRSELPSWRRWPSYLLKVFFSRVKSARRTPCFVPCQALCATELHTARLLPRSGTRTALAACLLQFGDCGRVLHHPVRFNLFRVETPRPGLSRNICTLTGALFWRAAPPISWTW